MAQWMELRRWETYVSPASAVISWGSNLSPLSPTLISMFLAETVVAATARAEMSGKYMLIFCVSRIDMLLLGIDGWMKQSRKLDENKWERSFQSDHKRPKTRLRASYLFQAFHRLLLVQSSSRNTNPIHQWINSGGWETLWKCGKPRLHVSPPQSPALSPAKSLNLVWGRLPSSAPDHPFPIASKHRKQMSILLSPGLEVRHSLCRISGCEPVANHLLPTFGLWEGKCGTTTLCLFCGRISF